MPGGTQANQGMLLTEGTVIVLGAGQAGGWAAAGLRSAGFTGRVVLIGDEAHRPYERPPLSKAVLAGEADAESCVIHPIETFEQLDLDFRPMVKGTKLDLAARTLDLDTGERLSYDRLILATGGRARPLPVPGADLPSVLSLRTVEDAAALGDRLRTGEPVVVIGGGWIGLEVAAVARGYGCEVTVVESADRLCVRTVPPELSDYLERLHTGHGVKVRLGDGVTAIESAGDALQVQLMDGTSLPARTVVVGVGLVPNDDLAATAGLNCDGGVVVDDRCRTSDPYVFAAGDVTVSPSRWAPAPRRLESWQNAQEQGLTAAKAALGLDVQHDILPWFWSDQYDVRLQIYGIPQIHHTMLLRGDPADEEFLVLFLDGDRMVSAMGPGAARDLRLCRRLIERGTPVDAAQLIDPAVPLPKR